MGIWNDDSMLVRKYWIMIPGTFFNSVHTIMVNPLSVKYDK